MIPHSVNFFFAFVILLIPFFLFHHNTLAQEKSNPFYIEAKAHYGFIIPHRTGIKNLVLGHVRAFEINYDIPTYGYKEWHQIYKYPTWGFSYYYGDLANPEQLGFATGIFPYINFSSVKKEKFLMNYHAGWGIGYVSKKFNRTENYKNIMIGSKLNAIISFGLEGEWKFSKRLSAGGGISFTHFSNGAFAMPNLGINIPSLNCGISYLVGNHKEFKRDSVIKPQKSHEICITANGGIKSVYPAGNPEKFPAFSLSATFGTTRSLKGKILPGIDLFYNTALFDYYRRAKITIDNKAEIFQPGLSVSFNTTISRITIMGAMGAYIYSKYKFDGPFYHRLGMRFYLSDTLFANVSVKTHFFKADFTEWGLGYKF